MSRNYKKMKGKATMVKIDVSYSFIVSDDV